MQDVAISIQDWNESIVAMQVRGREILDAQPEPIYPMQPIENYPGYEL